MAAPFGLVTTALGDPEIRLSATGVPDGIQIELTVRARGDEPVPQLLASFTLPDGAFIVSTDGTVAENEVSWEHKAVPGNQWIGPHSAVLRFAGTDPNLATVSGRIRWSGPSGGSRASGALSLLGLYGEVGVRRTLLPTGLTVITRERLDTETIAVCVSVRAGSRDEDDISSGGSHWLEHAHFLGTDKRPDNQAVFGSVEAVGGDMNATTSWELTDYFIAAPSDQIDLALDVLSDMLLKSNYDEEAFNRERKVVFEEMNRRANTPGTLAFDTFYTNVFKVHPARRPVGGTIETIRDLPISTILSYHEQRYVSGNMNVAVVGKITHQEAVDRVDALFSTVPRGKWIDREDVTEPEPIAPSDTRISLGNKQAQIYLGSLAPSLSDADRAAFFVLDGILDAPGRRLAAEIRDRRGLASSVGTSYLGLVDSGAWVASAVTQPEHVEGVIDLIKRELTRIANEPVTSAEIDDAVRSIRGGRRIGEERNLGQARRLSRESALGLLRPTRELFDMLEAVTPADVQRVAQACFKLDTLTQVVVTF